MSDQPSPPLLEEVQSSYRWMCEVCQGTGWLFGINPLEDGDITCPECCGAGWFTPDDFRAVEPRK